MSGGADAHEVEAAGGVIWRQTDDGRLQVVLVHRDRYDDWSLPKGKLEPGEGHEEAALREVQEETTLVASLGQELPSTTYLDRSGRRKKVRYWAMTVAEGEPTGSAEVDRAEWVDLDEALGRLSYRRDAQVVRALAGALRASEEGS